VRTNLCEITSFMTSFFFSSFLIVIWVVLILTLDFVLSFGKKTLGQNWAPVPPVWGILWITLSRILWFVFWVIVNVWGKIGVGLSKSTWGICFSRNPASYLYLHKPRKPALGWNMLHTTGT
jgi:hypothetical protein